jgi:hypothetical protein
MDNFIAVLPKSLKISEKTCKLDNVPAGSLFYYNGTFALMTEYSYYKEGMRKVQRDAYIIGTGEYFWGGCTDTVSRSNLKVNKVFIE